MTFDDYKALPFENFSRLKNLMPPRTPAHYKAALETDQEETIDMRLGSGVHAWSLEGKKFPYAVRPVCNPVEPTDLWHGNKLWCKAWVKAQTIQWYSPEEEERLHRMTKALDRSDLFQTLLELCPEREKVVTAELMGLPMKARLDMAGWWEGSRLIVDLKKTPDACPRAWGRRAHQMHYDAQMFIYSSLLAMEERLERPPMVLHAVVEDSDATPVAIYSVPPEEWASGEEKTANAIKLLRDCREKVEWPGYTTDSIIAPLWPKYATPDEQLYA